MKQQWQSLAAKLDTRNQRERAMISATVVVVVAFLLNTLMLDPLLAKKKKAMQEVATQQAQLNTLRSQIQATVSGGKADPDAPNRIRLAGLEQKLKESHAALQRVQENLVPPEKMGRMLEDVLAQNRGLKLVALKTLAVSNVLGVTENAPASTPATKGKSAEVLKNTAPTIYKHGVEIAVSGSYGELTQYLDALEMLPWRMYWNKADMQVEEYPHVTLTITLFTLSMDKSWMAI